jgi:hypothetical protein
METLLGKSTVQVPGGLEPAFLRGKFTCSMTSDSLPAQIVARLRKRRAILSHLSLLELKKLDSSESPAQVRALS